MKSAISEITFLIFIIFSFKSFAEEDSLSTHNQDKLSFDKKWAVQIEESKYHGFTYTSDLAFIGKKYLSSNSAVRGGVSILGLIDDGYSNNYSHYSNSTDYNIQHVGSSLNGAELFVQYIYYPVSGKTLNMFLGGGTTFISFTRKTIGQNYNVLNDFASQYSYSERDNAWGIGASLSLGVEWCPYRHIGITAEYGALILAINHNYDLYTTTEISPAPFYSSSSNSILELAFSDIKIGVQVYL